MSNFKRASIITPSVAANGKPVLPAELIELVLDYLPMQELMRFACTSKRMREMVYDDSRWVKRLQSMGVWDEAEARKRAEEMMRRMGRGPGPPAAAAAAANGSVVASLSSASGVSGRGGGITTLFDAGFEEERERQRASVEKERQVKLARARKESLSSGFENITMGTNGTPSAPQPAYRDPMVALKVLSKVRSLRGAARQEYGKVYGALAPFYFDMARSTSHTDPVLFQTYRDPEQQAQMLAQLEIFAKSDYADGWYTREERLESMTSIFENAVLREFEQGYEAQDYDGRMRRYAHVLVTLNGGAGGIDIYIQNHTLMVHKDRLGNPLDCIRDAPIGGISPGPSYEFFRSLSMSLNEQAAVIDRVFPPTVDVLLPFVERVGEDIISEYITTVLDEAHGKNIESYLKAVASLLEQGLQFANSLQPAKASKPDFPEQVKQVVTRCFEPHADLYLNEEIDFFKSKSNAEVDAWEKRLKDEEASNESFYMSNVNRQAVKNDFLSSFKKVVMMPVNVLPTIPISSPFSFATSKTHSSVITPTTAISNSDTLEPPSRSSTPVPGAGRISPKPGSEAPTNELAAKAAIMSTRLAGLAGLFSIEIALNLTHAAKSSLERAALLVKMGGQSGEEAREQCEAIFVALLQILGTRHIKTGFDKAVNHLSDYDPRTVAEHSRDQGGKGVEPLVTFLELVNVGDLIQQMIDVFFLQELAAAKLVDRDDFLSPAVNEKKRFEQMLDERVAAGLNKGIDVLIDEVEFICATTQPPGAATFNPGAAPTANGKQGGAVDFDMGPTETAKKVVDIVSSHTSMLVGSTDKNMLEVFNQEVGVRLFQALCKHLKRQRVSVDGSIKLISDTTHYYSYIVTLKNKALTPYFAALRELAQIYLIDAKHYPKELASIIADQDKYYGIFRAEEVLEFAERRADWFEVRTAVERAMFGLGCIVM
ncbi:secretion pathway protein Sls2/Rcy1 [Rhizodiscina lignyota]|uniref:Secretion pathway protein Sls2/Rcy1 n=1 Tax=Rhizodiscina lignyota TaxID=1504668 RepID=A0A9P4IEY4_9PEZI|nr:secretion pathway protein Sls2/Rcy1 [Rhizodiscina lignyota]